MMPIAPPVPAMRSELAATLDRDGYIVCDGTVTGTAWQPGTSYATVSVDCPDLTRATQTAGGGAVTIPVDVEIARRFVQFTEVEIAIRIKGR